jgi:hypothetical protein
MKNLSFNYSFYSHPEIGNFRVWQAIHVAFSSRPPPTPAPSRAGSLRATHHRNHYLDQHIIARLSILILSKTYPLVITSSPNLDHERLFGYWIAFAKK